MENNSLSKVIKSGFLKKRSKFLHLWKTRFCVLTNKYLFAFTGIEKDADCTMTLELKDCKDVSQADDIGKDFAFKLTEKSLVYYFQAENEQERNQWIKMITNNIPHECD